MLQEKPQASAPLYIRMREDDNVAIVANGGGLHPGAEFAGGLRLIEQIPQGHKVALQDIAAELHGNASTWSVHRLEFRAPGTTRVSLSEATAKGASPDQFKAALNVESSDPDTLMNWLQARGDVSTRSQKPLRLRGDVTIAPGGFAIDAMKAEIDGGAVEGRVAVSHRDANNGSKISIANSWAASQ